MKGPPGASVLVTTLESAPTPEAATASGHPRWVAFDPESIVIASHPERHYRHRYTLLRHAKIVNVAFPALSSLGDTPARYIWADPITQSATSVSRLSRARLPQPHDQVGTTKRVAYTDGERNERGERVARGSEDAHPPNSCYPIPRSL